MKAKAPAKAAKPNLRSTLTDAFEASSIDEPGEDAPVVITMPAENFSAVRDVLEL